jgi:phospholipase/lecithinase/hemolysin
MNLKLITRARCFIVALVFSLLAGPAVAAGTAFSKIVVFGDSLNDRGNMVQFTNGVFPNAPTFTYGRQTNGAVWVEYLAARLSMADKIVNYAVVGAMTKPTAQFPTGNVWSDTFAGLEGTDVTSQVSDYLADANGVADPAALYILEGGANDFPRVADPSVIIGNLVQCLVALESRGAKHIMVVNLPDIGRTPRVILAEQLNLLPPGTAQFLSAVCGQLNLGLGGVVTAVSPADVTITVADLYGFMRTVTQNGAAYGFVNVQLPYLLFGAGADQKTWLFWDDLHPTTRGHEILADQAVTSLLQSYSPSNGKLNAQGAVNALKGLVKAPKG